MGRDEGFAHVFEMPPLRLAGRHAVLRASAGGPMNRGLIAPLWQRVRAEAEGLGGRTDPRRFAVITGDLPSMLAEQAGYHAMVAVEDDAALPDGWSTMLIPAGRVVSFVHRGPLPLLGRTTTRVFSEWLPSSGEQLRESLELLVIPADHDRDDPEAEIEYRLMLVG